MSETGIKSDFKKAVEFASEFSKKIKFANYDCLIEQRQFGLYRNGEKIAIINFLDTVTPAEAEALALAINALPKLLYTISNIK